MSASGAIKYMRPGHRHKRFVKSPKRNAGLRKGQMLHEVITTFSRFHRASPKPFRLNETLHMHRMSLITFFDAAQAYAKVMRQLGFRRNAF